MAKRDFYIKDSELDDIQVQIVNKKIDSSFIVTGCAGSGKSILALWKAKQIQELNKSYLFVVYTKVLRKYMEDGITQIGLDDDNIIHYDDCFCSDEYGNRNWCKGDYEFIIVDEAQDLSLRDIEILKSHSRRMLIFGDSSQQMYAFRKSNPPASIREIYFYTGYPMEQLFYNHRLPKKVARFAQCLNSENDDIEGRCILEGEDKPKILEYSSKNAQFDAIATLIENKNLEDVGILFRNNKEIKDAYNYLKGLGLDVEAKYDIKENGKIKDKLNDLNFSSDSPKLITYHSSKGLQFENVFLPECVASNKDDKNLLYVAITRTYNSLYIMHSGNLSNFFATIPVDLYDTTLSSDTEIII